jgi:GNAT superfamily N-acetyltransferase
MYLIREATAADVDTILQIANDTWWPTYGQILSKEQVNYMLQTIYSAENISAQIQSRSQIYLLLIEHDKPVAFAAYSQREDNADIYKLHKLYCLPVTQGKGYGKILINTVAEKTKEAGKHILDLNVNRYNKAKDFYEKIGFSVVYEEDIAIGPYWMNDYVMRKQL